ncbi:hypothetical protein HK100_012543 [Physocladia obscura]|uniref:Amino acid transporter transmembrane domain-containing protein n=1 Tax=Physocladia obscura TaxID=109957 RepID=A0AAD5T277_9FUNG|nr:hypothetical protein HK100_012543 [Physocladia obscura]
MSQPVDKKIEDIDADTNSDKFAQLVAEEQNHDIKFRTLSWQKTAFLLLTEYICLAMLALAWSYMVLGWVAAIGVTLLLSVSTWYTSYVCWQYCMKHPHVRDIVDIALQLSGGNKFVGEATAVMLILNNVFLMGFHVLTGSKILNTLTDHSQCTAVFQVITAIVCFIFSLPRTLNQVSLMGVLSSLAMGIAMLLTLIYSGIQDHPGYGYDGNWPTAGATVVTTALPMATTFIAGTNAVLNITFLFIGQILYPSFIAEMKNPKDFPKALAVLTVAEIIVFFIAASVGYAYNGQYSTAPLIGSLEQGWMKKSAFAFVIIPTVVIGVLYANVAGKFIFRRIIKDSIHGYTHTVYGWSIWTVIQALLWGVSFLLGETIPSMGDFLSLMSAAFDSFFGYIFWSLAWFQLNKGNYFSTPRQTIYFVINATIFLLGLFMLGPGLYTSMEAIIADYSGPTNPAFSCHDNSL